MNKRYHPRWNRTTTVLCALLVAAAASAGAQEVEIAPGLPGWTGIGVTYQPASALRDESFLVVWGTERTPWSDPLPERVSVRRVSYPSGLGPPYHLFNGIGHDPAVAFDPVNRRSLVTWVEFKDPEFGATLWGTVVDEDGAQLCPAAFQILDSDCAGVDEVSVAYNQTWDHWLVLWENDRLSCGVPPLQSMIVEGCEPTGDLETIYEGTGAESPSLSYNPTADCYLAVWGDSGQIWGQRLDASGTAVEPRLEIASCEPDCDNVLWEWGAPSAVYKAASNRWLVFWTDGCVGEGPDRTCGYLNRVLSRAVLADGCGNNEDFCTKDPPACLKKPIAVTDGSSHARFSDAAMNTKRNVFFTAWTQGPEGSDASDVYGQWLKSNAKPFGDPLVCRAEPTEEKTPEGGGNIACSATEPHCLVVLNEWRVEWISDVPVSVEAFIHGVFVNVP